MKTRTENILMVLKIVAWLAAIGYCIEFGGQLTALVVSLVKPDISSRLYYAPPDLLKLGQYNRWYFVAVTSFVTVISALKACTFYLVIRLMSKLNLKAPFSMEVAKRLEKVAYLLILVWLVSVFSKGYLGWVSKVTGETLDNVSDGGEFLLVAGIVYVVSQIFKRGIEIQEENQLTV